MHLYWPASFPTILKTRSIRYLWRPQTRDPGDDMVLETALNGRADKLVTLNMNDFIVASHFRLPVLTPGAMLRQLNREVL